MKIELAHDRLAEAIFGQIAAEEKQHRQAHALIDARYYDFQAHQEMLLGEAELKFIDNYLADLELSTSKKAFVEKSRSKIKLAKRRIRSRNYIIIALATAVVFLPIAIWGWNLAFHAQNNQFAAEEEAFRNQQALAEVEEENDELRRVVTGDSMPRIVNLKELKTTTAENLRDADMTYATIQIKGQVLNEAGRAIPEATIRLMGAELKTNKRGYFECYFVLPPLLRVKSGFYIDVEKTNYKPLRQKVKTEAELELKLILKSK
jgi:hypothetical protein